MTTERLLSESADAFELMKAFGIDPDDCNKVIITFAVNSAVTLEVHRSARKPDQKKLVEVLGNYELVLKRQPTQ